MNVVAGLLLCQKGNEALYCTPDTAEWWASQGWAVYELVPNQVAGPRQDAEETRTERTEVMEATETVPDVSGMLTRITEETNA